MANDKEVIQKLLKIAENQQKIITKLAQLGASPLNGGSSSWDDVSSDVAAKLATIPGAKGYSVNNAECGAESGTLRGKLVYPASATNYYDVLKALKNQLVGKSVKTSDGKEVQVSSNPQDVSFIGMS
jgi:hypothetical protein